MFLLSLALAPVVLFLIFIYSRDVCSKEPPKMLASAIGGGILSALATITLVQIVALDAQSWDGIWISSLGTAFLEAAIPEELCKFLFLYLIVWKSPHFDEYFDGIVYATFVSMGFAGFENIFYVLEGGTATAIARALTAVPGHFFFAVIMGYYFSLAKFDAPQNRTTNLIKAYFFAMLAHGIYDTICFMTSNTTDTDEYGTLILAFVILFLFFNFKLWKYGLKRIKELRERDIEQPPAEFTQKQQATNYSNDVFIDQR